mmetsp:Transcript_20723/g.52626  ORF Transcript_20723/g.52626 Transcript_20723/m.52626 type:complete len:225 (+) Transcript_20723:1016-1690(+)
MAAAPCWPGIQALSTAATLGSCSSGPMSMGPPCSSTSTSGFPARSAARTSCSCAQVSRRSPRSKPSPSVRTRDRLSPPSSTLPPTNSTPAATSCRASTSVTEPDSPSRFCVWMVGMPCEYTRHTPSPSSPPAPPLPLFSGACTVPTSPCSACIMPWPCSAPRPSRLLLLLPACPAASLRAAPSLRNHAARCSPSPGLPLLPAEHSSSRIACRGVCTVASAPPAG